MGSVESLVGCPLAVRLRERCDLGGRCYAEGWRRADVYRIAEAKELSVPARYDCRRGLNADTLRVERL